MPAHRLLTPPSNYFLQGGGGPLLPSYDFINDPPANGDPGAASPADGKKASGPNEGTYFVAFAEDATSSNTNRGMQAHGQNFDFVDDLLNRQTSRPTTLSFVAGGGGDASKTLTGSDVYVGIPGTANDQPTRSTLISVLDANDNEFEVGGQRVVVTLIHDGASTNVVGVPATGFYNAPTANFSPAIPASTAYKLAVGLLSSSAHRWVSFPGVLSQSVVDSGRVTAEVQALFRTLHAVTGQAWDAAWDSTIRALAASGLNERYRRQTTVPGSFNFDTAGDGAIILRDGAAPQSKVNIVTPHLDPLNALWVVKSGGSRGTGAQPLDSSSGPSGFVAYSSRRSRVGASSNDDGEVLTNANFMSVWPHDFAGDITSARTQITPSRAAAVNPGGALPTTLELHASDFFHTGGGTPQTALCPRVDMIEVTRASGAKQVYLVSGLNAANVRRCTLAHLDGEAVPAFPSDEAVTARWLSMLFHQGAEAQNWHTNKSTGVGQWASFFHAVPPYLTTAPSTSDAIGQGARFFASDIDDPAGAGAVAPSALEWGGFYDGVSFATSAEYRVRGKLFGDGSLETTLQNLRTHDVVLNSTGGTTTWHPRQDGSFLVISAAVAAGAAHTIAFAASYVPRNGDVIYVAFRQDATSGLWTTGWPAGLFQFSGGDATLTTGVSATSLYRGIYTTALSTAFLMTKTSYSF